MNLPRDNPNFVEFLENVRWHGLECEALLAFVQSYLEDGDIIEAIRHASKEWDL